MWEEGNKTGHQGDAMQGLNQGMGTDIYLVKLSAFKSILW